MSGKKRNSERPGESRAQNTIYLRHAPHQKKRSSHSSAGIQVSKAPEKRTSQNLTLDHGGEFARHTQWVQDVWASDLIFATLMPSGKKGAARIQMDVCPETCLGKWIFRHSRRKNSMKPSSPTPSTPTPTPKNAFIGRLFSRLFINI
ncbi:MAG: hypothetical protein K2P90_02520 [Holosporales bacterium]|nr:hypothetical protein [Holosporales bacterium]